MGKGLKVLVLGVVATILITTSAMGAMLRNSQGQIFGTGNDVTTSYRIAYEVYSETAGVSTIADDGASIGMIDIILTQPLAAGETANLVIPSGADFNSAGPNYKFGLCDLEANAPGDTVCDPGEIIGVVPTPGVVTSNLSFSILGTPVGNTLRVVQWEDTGVGGAGVNDNQYTWNDVNGDGVIDPGEAETLLNGVGIYVKPGLGATCTNQPIIKVDFSTPHETTPQPYNFAYITPQFTSTGPTANDFTAELNSDTDFETFVLGSGPNISSPTQILDTTFITITNIARSPMWIAYAVNPPVGNIQFNLNSAIVEPNVSLVRFDVQNCITNDQRTWQCSVTGVPLVGPHTQEISVTGTASNNPTNWTISDFSMTVTTIGLRDLCVNIPPSSVGAWWGGVEAIVPYVKHDPANGAYTTIVLFNRRDVEVPIYAQNMLADPNPIITVSQEPIIAIPAQSKLVLTGEQLGSLLGVSASTLAEGFPVKFLFRVPTQSLVGNVSVNIPGIPTTATGEVIPVNPFDPYIEGYVIYDYAGTSRTVPLKFKIFRQGSYTQ